MQMSGEQPMTARPEHVWAALNDPEAPRPVGSVSSSATAPTSESGERT